MASYSESDLVRVVLFRDAGGGVYEPYAIAGTAIAGNDRVLGDCNKVVLMRDAGGGVYEPYEA